MNRFSSIGLLVLSLSLVIAACPADADVAATADDIRPILIGSTVPNVEVRTLSGEAIGLGDALGGRTTALIIYRGGWCPICNRQLSELRHAIAPLRELGVATVAVSADTPERLQVTRNESELDIDFLSDFELRAAQALGLAFRVSDEYVAKLAEYGLDTEGNAVSSQQILPVPAVFVVDAEGVITFSYVNPNYRVRCAPGVLIAAAEAAVGER